jgi:alpha-tubulin suppressor-like RCC1 family protein
MAKVYLLSGVLLGLCLAPGSAEAQTISSNVGHTLVAKPDGTVWAWGTNSSGQLGDGTTTRRDLPKQVPGLTDVTSVAAGGDHSLALKSDGTVWAWGSNGSGRLGNGNTTQQLSPVQVSGLTGVVAIAAG